MDFPWTVKDKWDTIYSKSTNNVNKTSTLAFDYSLK